MSSGDDKNAAGGLGTCVNAQNHACTWLSSPAPRTVWKEPQLRKARAQLWGWGGASYPQVVLLLFPLDPVESLLLGVYAEGEAAGACGKDAILDRELIWGQALGAPPARASSVSLLEQLTKAPGCSILETPGSHHSAVHPRGPRPPCTC